MTFIRHQFKLSQLKAYFTSAKKDLKIAFDIENPDVRFRFAYDALIKLAITISAYKNLRVKSRAGHHIELIEKLARILGDKKIIRHGNEMRIKRNKNIYDGGVFVSQKEADYYVGLVREIFVLAEEYIDRKKGREKFEF